MEVDEEGFDDFGRRVKKGQKSDRQAKEEAALRRLNEKYKYLLPGGNAATFGQDSNTIEKEKSRIGENSRDIKASKDNQCPQGSNERRNNSRDRNQKPAGKDFRDNRSRKENSRDRRNEKDRDRRNDRDRFDRNDRTERHDRKRSRSRSRSR